MSGLADIGRAMFPNLLQASAVPGIVRPAAGQTMSPRKRAAGNAVLAAWSRLQAAQAQCGTARSRHLTAAVDRVLPGDRSGKSAHDRRLATKEAASGAEAVLRTLQLRQAEYDAAVREFNAAV